MQENGLLKQMERVVKQNKHSFFDNATDQCKQLNENSKIRIFNPGSCLKRREMKHFVESLKIFTKSVIVISHSMDKTHV